MQGLWRSQAITLWPLCVSYSINFKMLIYWSDAATLSTHKHNTNTHSLTGTVRTQHVHGAMLPGVNDHTHVHAFPHTHIQMCQLGQITLSLSLFSLCLSRSQSRSIELKMGAGVEVEQWMEEWEQIEERKDDNDSEIRNTELLKMYKNAILLWFK